MRSSYLKYLGEIEAADKKAKIIYAVCIIVIGLVIAVLGTYESVVSLFRVCFSLAVNGAETKQVVV